MSDTMGMHPVMHEGTKFRTDSSRFLVHLTNRQRGLRWFF